MMRQEERVCTGSLRPGLALGALLAVVVAAAGAGAPGTAAEAGAQPRPVSLSAGEQARLGITTTVLAAATAPAGVATTARVLDPAPLIQLDAEIGSAAASLAASRAEAARTRQLYAEDRTASARALQTAEAQAAADQERLLSAQRRLLIEWGQGVARLSDGRRAGLLDELARVRAELVRVELPAGAATPAPGSAVELHGSAEQHALRASVLGLLPVADPRLQTRGVLAEVKGADATLAVGEMLSARLPSATHAARGVRVPRAALLRKDAAVWVYVQTAPNGFVRRELRDYQPLPDGWFVGGGLAPGDRVVTAGAEMLLGLEAPPADTGAD
jgi:hypothetical protein